ncbi:putative C6 finger domain protein [Aspergillus ruber CBS 135680]|uniref:Zn(2)-C6 fungal-type domain-containing protein n=1 Tax=Aspergillus ruber (strain CBS 135680) TaxID=1388766 RepID=A0A017S977_ASPRC|nr:uncharacterized protein EURHEDRAFT_460941 [Aspergillus ruber CBS 135680]EYE93184.1 hypothetical protein EURHEDRAFT_460941 [Aspergillus ruber CBS 135680]
MDSTIPPSSTPTDKKRNKLGYHRTSVACVHCRRRKIRCLVAADDAQGRCENCIRLRKECQFFPVDQQPPVEKKTRPNSRLDSSASTDPSTASSSPPIVSGPLDQQQPQQQQPETFFYQPMPLNAAPNVHGIPPNAPFPGNMPQFAPGRLCEFTSASLESPVPWDEFTTVPNDPQMLATLNAAKPQSAMIDLSPTSVWSGDMSSIPSNASLQTTPTVPSQQPAQALDIANTPAQTFTMPDGTVWQVPPQPTRSMTFPAQPDMAASYPPPPVPPTSTPNQFAPPMDPDPKHSASPAADPMQTMTMSMSYPGTQVSNPIGYPVWPDASGMAGMNVVPYPVFTPEAPQQGTPFGSPPMGHGHPGHSPQG